MPTDVPTWFTSGLSADDKDRLADVEAGLDALQTPSGAVQRGAAAAWRRAWPPLVAVVVVLAVWEGVVLSGVQPIWNLPGPREVATAIGTAARDGSLWEALTTSLSRGVLGFLAAVAIGTPLGVVVARVRWIRVTLGPIITGLQVLPSVAWVPAAIIWFGLSNGTVYFVVLMGAVPSIVNGIVAGVDQVPPLLRQVGRVLGAGRVAMVTDIVLPAALPGYLAGLKQGWAFSWRSLMAAEIIAVGGSIGFGLGQFLDQGRQLADMSLVFTAILLILAVGIVVELAVFAPVERAVLRSRGLRQEAA
ncbi:ABC transporter permease [Xylanimonas sp. McL0601]|uniref:ABC transporter permease n=1 Tax=Xylanimonas sp. McL0601 TaxID=3414739 RepID=UPI003CFA6FEF